MQAQLDSDEQELISRVLEGDMNVFRVLVERYEPKLRAYLSRKYTDPATVDDLLQESFVSAYKNLSKYKPQYAFGAWLFGITRNKVNDFFRKHKPTYELVEDDRVESNTPSTLTHKAEAARSFWSDAQDVLSEIQYSVVWLKYQEGLGVKEIAVHVGESESNIKVLLFRARKALANSTKTVSLLQESVALLNE